MKTFRDLPKDDVTGEWKFSISDSGYSNCDVMLEVVEDLDNYVIEKQIPKPVILFMDGFKGHYGIEINEECDKQGIQLWLLRAHMSHIIQPADVVMFNAVKRRAKMKAHEWQGKHPSETLNRYTFIGGGCLSCYRGCLQQERDCCFLCLVCTVMTAAQLPVWTVGKAPHS